ncbi:arylphorin subunit alpha-like [Arctopsyche grandis]|uniref:arylphorin subunit alpha-like n=1 Tax=Arctopsyche grandis TaxID=121162 RepID=UPI00406D6F85
MKFLVFFAAFLVLATASYIKQTEDFKNADKDFLLKQQKIFDLLNHVNQEFGDEYVKIAKEYSIEDHIDQYTNAKAVKEFAKFYKRGFVPKFKLFSLTFDKHRDEAVALFNVFYYAKDFETFYKTACWAREFMNQGVFVYSFTVAVLHREDCHGFVLPAPYEIYPFYFVSSDVLAKANYIKQQGYVQDPKLAEFYGIHFEDNTYTFYDNYTQGYDFYDQEQKVSYFTNDIGLNSYYFYFHADYPFWLGGEQFGLNKDRRGELYYFTHQQLLARYYLERLSNGLGEIPSFNWRYPVKTQYNPNMAYPNGYPFPRRQENFYVNTDKNEYLVQEVEDYERRIRDAVTQGFVTLFDGTKLFLKDYSDIETLGRFVQSNPDFGDIRFYDYLSVIAKFLLGGAVKPYDTIDYVPSALEQYQTAMRDPVFYQLYKRFMSYFFRFKQYMPSYTKEELYFPGVKVENVEFTRLKTYFENFTYDITNGVYMNKQELSQHKEKYVFQASQKRLNHQKFNVNYEISSEKDTEASFRVFFGPKYDSFGRHIKLNDNKYNFVEVDYFVYKLKSGKNSFVRKNTEFSRTVYDRTPARELYKKVLTGIAGEGEFKLDQSEAHNGWPLRLLVPKGRRDGMVYQFYVIVTPFKQAKVPFGSTFPYQYSAGVGSGSRYYEDLPFGFPFDREIDETYFYTPNMYFGDMIVYHSDSYSKKNDVAYRFETKEH